MIITIFCRYIYIYVWATMALILGPGTSTAMSDNHCTPPPLPSPPLLFHFPSSTPLNSSCLLPRLYLNVAPLWDVFGLPWEWLTTAAIEFLQLGGAFLVYPCFLVRCTLMRINISIQFLHFMNTFCNQVK